MQASGRQHSNTSAEHPVRLTASPARENSHELDSQLSLDRLPEFLSERLRGARGTDLSASLLHEMSRTEDLQGSLLELHVQGGRLYGQAMSALQRVLGNAGVERLHQELSALAEGNANADGGAQDVQLKQGAGARPSNAELLDAAADGASTSGDAVPFAQEMEALLGVDFSSTRAHIGAEAETACEEMGAQAYTYGENVVFREANPSKEIVAHELTHVVQQRQGVQLTGGVGQVGDAYEQQAEQAERGVAPLMEGPQASATLAVQAKEAEEGAPSELEVSNVLFELEGGQFVALDELKAHLAKLDSEEVKVVLGNLKTANRAYDLGNTGTPEWATLEFCLSKVEGDPEAVAQIQSQVHALEAELDEVVTEETEQRAAQLAAVHEGVGAASSGVEGGVQDGLDAADAPLLHVSINQKLGYQAGAIELVRKALGLSASSVVDEALVLALRARTDLASDILEHGTLLALAPELVSAGDLSAKAKFFYREKGQRDGNGDEKKDRPIGADHYEVIREHYETQDAEHARLMTENVEPGGVESAAGTRDRDLWEADGQALERAGSEDAGAGAVTPEDAPRTFAAGEPYATILKELALSADAAFDNLSELDAAINDSTQKKKPTVEVSEVFVERALVWQIEAHLGLTLDAMLGTDSLALMGLNTVTSAYARWNVDNLELTKEDPALKEAIAKLPSKRQGEVNAQTDYTHKKRFGDVTGDDGVSFGMAHFTSVGKLTAFFEHIQKHWREQQEPGATFDDTLRMQSNPLQVHFGVDKAATPEEAAKAAAAFLGLDENEKADNAVLVRLRNTKDPTDPTGKGTLLDRFLAFCRDPDSKRLQLSFNEKKAKKVFAGASVGTGVMLKLMGSSSESGKAVEKLRDPKLKLSISEAQEKAGLLYIESGPEKAPYKKVAKVVWERALKEKSLGGLTEDEFWEAEVARLISADLLDPKKENPGKAPTQKLRRLLSLVDSFGTTWDEEYSNK